MNLHSIKMVYFWSIFAFVTLVTLVKSKDSAFRQILPWHTKQTRIIRFPCPALGFLGVCDNFCIIFCPFVSFPRQALGINVILRCDKICDNLYLSITSLFSLQILSILRFRRRFLHLHPYRVVERNSQLPVSSNHRCCNGFHSSFLSSV